MLGLRHLSLAALCSLSFALSACGETATPDPRLQLPLVKTATVSTGTVSLRSFTGTVGAKVQSDLGFRVSGKILERLVDTGQSVKRGQPLVRMDPVDLRLAAQAQDNAVMAAKAQAKQAMEEEARYRDLRGTGAISASAYDQVKAAADAAAAQLSAAQAQANVARNATHYAQLLADADGIVMNTLAEPGQVVAAGQVVVRLAHAGKREAVVQLPETLRPALGSLAQASLFGQTAPPVQAQLRQLSEVANDITRTFEARYVLDGALSTAPLGATVTLTFSDAPQSAERALQVPLNAIFDAGQGPAVWLVTGDRVARQAVAILGIQDEQAQVTGELKQGDEIVALGAHLLTEGAQVRVMAQTMQTTPVAPAATTTAAMSAGAARE